MIAVAVVATLFTAGPVMAETCTGYYNDCINYCKAPGKSQYCGKCTSYRAACMATGKWTSRTVKYAPAERR